MVEYSNVDEARKILKQITGSSQVLSATKLVVKVAAGMWVFGQVRVVSANLVGEAVSYSQQQLGSNALVLAFGYMVGSGAPMSPARGFLHGPLQALNRALWLFGMRTVWDRVSVNLGTVLAGEDTKSVNTMLRKHFGRLGWPVLAAVGVWAWSFVAGSVSRLAGGLGLGVALYETILTVATVYMHIWTLQPTVSCLVSPGYPDDEDDDISSSPPPPGDSEDGLSKREKAIRKMRELRDFVVEQDLDSFSVRVSGSSVDVVVDREDNEYSGLRVRLLNNAIPRWARFILGGGELILCLWWLLVMTLPAVEDCSWWPVLAIYIIATLRTSNDTSAIGIDETWVTKDVLERSRSMIRRAVVHNMLGVVWLSDLQLYAGLGSVYAAACTSGQLEDGFSVGKTVQLINGVHASLMEVWRLGLSLDASPLNSFGKDRYRDDAFVEEYAAFWVEVIRRLIDLGEHCMTCQRGAGRIMRGDLTQGMRARRLLLAAADRHDCAVVRESLSWFTSWVIDNWKVLAFIGAECWPMVSEDLERLVLDDAPDFTELVRTILNAALSPSENRSLEFLAIEMMLVFLDKNSARKLTRVGPAAAVWSAWVDGLKVRVLTTGGDVRCVIGNEVVYTGVQLLTNPRASNVMCQFRLGAMGREARGLLKYLEERRRGWGMSQEIIVNPAPLAFPWASHKIQAAGSGSSENVLGQQLRSQRRAHKRRNVPASIV